MKEQCNVLIIPGGSGMAVAAIKALAQDKKIKIFSADSNKLAPGLYLASKGYVIPPFDSRQFYPKLKGIIKKDKIDIIIPALDTILLSFSQRRKEFEEIGSKVIVSQPETIRITRDKWITYRRLKDVIPLPKTFIRKEDVDVDYPLIIKPRNGSGSKDVYKVESKYELEFFYSRVPNAIIQEYLEGKEYTVDCLADMNGNLLLCIPRERIETKSGISTKGRIKKDARLEDMAKKIANSINFSGPFFFQAKEDKEGIPKLTEINPRISGTMSLSSSSGPNIHSLAVRIFMGEKVKIPKIKYGLYVTRYWEDIYLTEKEIDKLIEEV
jgi:carbamoyl-phosphate synthase large subunit